jgi:hypothetical protein
MKPAHSWKDCTDSRKVEYTAHHAGIVTYEAAGSHFILEAPNGDKIAAYHGEISTGVACKLFKFFKQHGAIMTVLLLPLIYALWHI